MSISAIETLWREYLQAYGEPQVRAELHRRWGGDANLTQERIQFNYPPTFQPGSCYERWAHHLTLYAEPKVSLFHAPPIVYRCRTMPSPTFGLVMVILPSRKLRATAACFEVLEGCLCRAVT